MKMSNKYGDDTSLLTPLKNRPDMDPDPIFTHSLSNLIVHNKKKKLSFSIKLVLATTLSILFFGILLYNFLITEQNSSNATNHKENKISKPNIVKFSYNIDTLLFNNPNYERIYKTILTKTHGSKASAETFIFYLEALKNKDENTVKKYSSDPEIATDIIDYYKNIDFSTIKIVKIVASKAEPTFQITLKFSKISEEIITIQSHTVELNVNDEITINIYDPGSSGNIWLYHFD